MNDLMGLASLSMITGDSVIYLSDNKKIWATKVPNDWPKPIQLATRKHDRKAELVRNHFCPPHFLFKVLSIELKSIYNYCAWISIEPLTKLLKCKGFYPEIQGLGCQARLLLTFSFELIYFYLLPDYRKVRKGFLGQYPVAEGITTKALFCQNQRMEVGSFLSMTQLLEDLVKPSLQR